jgi:hypothetical protein
MPDAVGGRACLHLGRIVGEPGAGSLVASRAGGNVSCRHSSPVPISGLSGVTSVVVGEMHTCALMGDGTVRCWGDNRYGQLGDGTTDTRTTPTTVPNLSHVAEIAAGRSHACARLESGAVYCWGRNYYGQVGDGTTTMRLVPTAVAW